MDKHHGLHHTALVLATSLCHNGAGQLEGVNANPFKGMEQTTRTWKQQDCHAHTTMTVWRVLLTVT